MVVVHCFPHHTNLVARAISKHAILVKIEELPRDLCSFFAHNPIFSTLRTPNILILKDNNPLKISGCRRCLQKFTVNVPPPPGNDFDMV